MKGFSGVGGDRLPDGMLGSTNASYSGVADFWVIVFGWRCFRGESGGVKIASGG